MNAAIGSDILRDQLVGIGKVGTFQWVCRACDERWFRHYEDPDQLGSSLSNLILGGVALKCCLQSVSAATQGVEFYRLLGERTGRTDATSLRGDVRSLDLEEDVSNCAIALQAIESGGGLYKLILDETLDYTAPLAFQYAIYPLADFYGNLINDLYNKDPAYRLEPLYLCVLPVRGKTRVFAFCHSDSGRYDSLAK